MGEHTLLLIILSILIILVAVIGYFLGALHRLLEARPAYIRQLQEHDRLVRANSALIHAIAQEYDSTTGPPPRRCHQLPEGWKVYSRPNR